MGQEVGTLKCQNDKSKSYLRWTFVSPHTSRKEGPFQGKPLTNSRVRLKTGSPSNKVPDQPLPSEVTEVPHQIQYEIQHSDTDLIQREVLWIPKDKSGLSVFDTEEVIGKGFQTGENTGRLSVVLGNRSRGIRDRKCECNTFRRELDQSMIPTDRRHDQTHCKRRKFQHTVFFYLLCIKFFSLKKRWENSSQNPSDD